MIKSKLQTIALALLATVALSAPVAVKAQDAAASPAASATPKAKKEKTQSATAKVASVDATAKTFKAGEHTFTVTDATKWEGDLTLDTLKAGTKVTVSYTKSGDTLTATDVKAAAAKK